MLKFVIGVDRRMGRFGADLERHLRIKYELCDFFIEGMRGGLPLTTIRELATQTDCLLEAIYDFPAEYYIALSSSTIILPSMVGPVPTPVTVLTAIDTAGQVLFDYIEPIGHWVSPGQRNYSHYKPPDLLDFVGDVVQGVLELEHQTAQAPL